MAVRQTMLITRLALSGLLLANVTPQSNGNTATKK
jgi:hypothetical protein